MIISDIWKNFGYNTIIYLAALTGIDPTLYEAAMVDGAGKIKQTIHVTMPGIAPFIALMTIMSIGSVLNAGFDQIFNLYSPAVYATGDIIDTLAEREVFLHNIRLANRKARVSFINGLTGQGAYRLASFIRESAEEETIDGKFLRFTMPSAVCSFCAGQMQLQQKGNGGRIKRMWGEENG